MTIDPEIDQLGQVRNCLSVQFLVLPNVVSLLGKSLANKVDNLSIGSLLHHDVLVHVRECFVEPPLGALVVCAAVVEVILQLSHSPIPVGTPPVRQHFETPESLFRIIKDLLVVRLDFGLVVMLDVVVVVQTFQILIGQMCLLDMVVGIATTSGWSIIKL